ncbi:MAG: class I SAM-dependent methyltransferase [Acidimicrobiales bacterium]
MAPDSPVPAAELPPFPPGFFDRSDPTADRLFYRPTRLVTHIDDNAIAAVGAVYEELAIRGRVLDLMSSWISHFSVRPRELVALGMNQAELDANHMADHTVVHDLNEDPLLPFTTGSFDAVTCCVSVDYLIKPVEVFADVARVLKPGGVLVCTFSNRCFPTKAIRGWLQADDDTHCEIVTRYFELTERYQQASVSTRIAPGIGSDPLYAVWARTPINS